MIKIKIGEGCRRSRSWRCSIGRLEAELTEGMKNMTFEKFAEALSKQYKITDGEVKLISIDFGYAKEAR